MKEDTSIIPFRHAESIDDPLTGIAREGARRMLAEALKAEADAFVASFADDMLPDGRQRVVRHGYGPERSVQTGIGALDLRRPKVRDRAMDRPEEGRARFTSNILPRWARRSKSLDALLPVLYLRGISTGDFREALSALLGRDAPNLSPGVISRLTAGWEDEHDAWQRRDLSARRYVYVWADGVYLQARMEPQAECILVVIGATPEGKKELVGFQVGMRESARSWRELLVDIKARGFAMVPEIAVGDGAMGFWKALDEVFPGTRHQRCRVGLLKNGLPEEGNWAITGSGELFHKSLVGNADTQFLAQIAPMARRRHRRKRRSARRPDASRFRLIAAAVRKDWMRMLSRPRRTALARPCQVFASP